MRIAILCKGLGHKECIGFIAELSKQLNYKIDVYRNNEYLVHNYRYYNQCGHMVKPFIHSFSLF